MPSYIGKEKLRSPGYKNRVEILGVANIILFITFIGKAKTICSPFHAESPQLAGNIDQLNWGTFRQKIYTLYNFNSNHREGSSAKPDSILSFLFLASLGCCCCCCCCPYLENQINCCFFHEAGRRETSSPLEKSRAHGQNVFFFCFFAANIAMSCNKVEQNSPRKKASWRKKEEGEIYNYNGIRLKLDSRLLQID